ncbi:MAG: hypothetical protein OIF36_02215 [Alphaproteobacteria bacterium]|nr:hypothetical protein [Alphaproteobacteria bacterium]
MSKKTVVVVPIYEELSKEDKVSLKCLKNNLKKHDKYILCPINFDLKGVNTAGFKIMRLSPGRFKTRKTALAMLMSKKFYSYFKDYDYMLYHKIGSVVFGDDEDLDKWAEKDYSYIGAPWFRRNKENRKSVIGGVGKGALSLRKIDEFIEIFDRETIHLVPQNRQSRKLFLEWRWWSRLKRYGAWIHLQNMVGRKRAIHSLIRKFDKKEDIFWAFFAVQINPKFKLPSFDEGYKFAIENTPYRIFPDTIPFGITRKAWLSSNKWDDLIEENLAKHKVKRKPKAKIKEPETKSKVVKAKKSVSKVKKAVTKKKSIRKTASK